MRLMPSRRFVATCQIVSFVLLVSICPFSRAGATAQEQSQSRLLQLPAINTLPSREKRWALIVGIDQYDKDVSSLKGAVNDALALKNVLIGRAGFPENQVVVLTSNASSRDQLPTRTNILEELDNLTNQIPPDGLLLFSFSGHGVSIDNEAYLIPSDGRITRNLKLLRDFSINVRTIKESIEDSKIKQVLILLDTCRNELGKGEMPNALTEAYRRGFSFDTANSGIEAFATLYATSVGERAFEFLDRDTKQFRGYFSHAIEEGLNGKAANARGEITLSGLTEYVDRVVPERVRSAKGEKQIPSKEVVGYKGELILAMALANANAGNSAVSNPRVTIDPVAVELEYWETIRGSNDIVDYESYLKVYPNGAYAGVAGARIRQLQAAKKTAPAAISPVEGQPNLSVESKPDSSVVTPNTSFTVNINVRGDAIANGWTSSGLEIRRGQQIHIRASGQINLGGGRSSTPKGLLDLKDSEKLMGTELTGGLIAVIGDDNDDFIFIGAEREFTAQRDGVLFLGVNEGNLTDNKGSYEAAIESHLLITPAPRTKTTVDRELSTTKVSVRADDANNGWTNSGVVVQRGQQIQISASGRVSLGNFRSSTPAGVTNLSDGNKLMRQKPTGGLIAVIGDDNDDFVFIGAEGEFTAHRDGVLFLGVNEGNLADNAGSYDVSIGASPPPATSQGSELSTTKVNVRADKTDNGWTNSGLVVRRGQQIRISASGRVSLGSLGFSTPAGLPSVSDVDKLMRLRPTGGLIAVIGDDNDDFIFIGADGEFTAQRDGVLFLGVNEGNLADNTGSYNVIVRTGK